MGDQHGTSISSANIFLSFRGTYIWDVVNNRRNNVIAMTLTSLCDQCAVMQGSYKNFLALRFSIAKVLAGSESKVTGNSKTIMLGMSMGATLATYAGVFLRVSLSKDVNAIYTFGGNRAGNNKFRDICKKIGSVLFIAYRDPVPHFPP